MSSLCGLDSILINRCSPALTVRKPFFALRSMTIIATVRMDLTSLERVCTVWCVLMDRSCLCERTLLL